MDKIEGTPENWENGKLGRDAEYVKAYDDQEVGNFRVFARAVLKDHFPDFNESRREYALDMLTSFFLSTKSEKILGNTCTVTIMDDIEE